MKKTFSIFTSIIFAVTFHTNAQQWKDYSDSADFYIQQKNNPKAIEYYLMSGELLKKDSAVTLTNFKTNNAIADLYVAIGQYARAEPFYISSKSIIEKIKGKENAEYATSCNNLGRVYRLLGQYDKSETLLLDAKQIREKIFGKNNADYAATCNNLAILYFEVGQYETARPFYLEAKEIREKVLGKDHIDYAASCNNVAILYATTGHPDLAEPLYIEAKNIREKLLGKEHPFYAASCNNLAVLYRDMGRYDKAEILYIEAKQIRERTLGKEHPDYATSCDNLAILYLDMGQFEKAEPLYLEAKQIRERVLGTGHTDYGRSCNNLAVFYMALGQYENAEPLFIQARNGLESVLGKENPEYAKSCNNLGALYMAMGNYKKAEALYTEAKSIWEKSLGKEHPEYAKSCHNLALIYRNYGQYEKAESFLVEANKVREKALGKEHPDYAQGCDNLAVIYSEMGEFNKAAALHLQAKEIREKALGKEHPDYVESCINLANLDWSLKKFEDAGSIYKEAFSSQQAQIKKIFQFTTEPEKQSYLKKVGEFKDYFLSYSSDKEAKTEPGYAYAVSLANRNLTLSSLTLQRESIYNTNDTALSNAYNNWISVREQLAFWYTKPVGQRKEQVTQLEQKANLLEKQLTRTSEQFRKGQQAVKWQEIQEVLQPNEAAIEFSAYHFFNGKRWTDSIYYIALVLRKNKPEPELVTLFEKRQLDSILTYKGTSAGQHQLSFLYTANNDDAQKSSLYNVIWKPLEKKLEGINTIYFDPAGLLYKIAFAALPVNATQVLSDKYKLIQLNSTASIIDKSMTFVAASDPIFLYGGIQYDVDSTSIKQISLRYSSNVIAARSIPGDLLRDGIADFYYLSGSEKEVKAIGYLASQKKYNKVTVEDGVEANEESVKALFGKNSPAILHVATHGFFFPDSKNTIKDEKIGGAIVFKQSDNPLIRSGLALAGANNAWKGKPVTGVEDGILTAYEVSNMYLPNTKLVVLSACETGLGDIQGSEGVYGLQRAFKIAGVKNLVMSLWKVDDIATSEFMLELYKNIFENQSIEDAFYHAQTRLKNRYRNDPYKWAAWILVR